MRSADMKARGLPIGTGVTLLAIGITELHQFGHAVTIEVGSRHVGRFADLAELDL